MTKDENAKALIYTHVACSSHPESAMELIEQHQLCSEHAKALGYNVVNAFDDIGTGNERPGIEAMIAFLKTHPHGKFRIVMTDVTRLSRDLTTCIELATLIVRHGGSIEVTESPLHVPSSEQFDTFLQRVLANIRPLLTGRMH